MFYASIQRSDFRPLYRHSHRPSSNHGGAAIYISPEIPYKRRHDLTLNIQNCESVWLEFDHNFLNIDNRNFIFGCVYRSPSSSGSDFCVSFETLMTKLSTENKNVIIMGDINLNLLDSSVNSVSYSSCFYSFGYECLTSVPTRSVPGGSSTLIDHALSNLLYPPEVGVLETDITDHFPVFLRTTSAHYSYSNCYTKLVFDKKSFLESVSNADWSFVLDTNDPQLAYSQFLTKLLSHYHSCSQMRKCKKKVASPQNPWVTDNLLKAMRARENLF